MGLSHSSEDPSKQDRNLRFYRNEIRSSPWPGNTVGEMLLWFGRYNKLENNHSYIQWLFPTPEGSGMNPSAQPLREHEAKAIREDEVASARVLMAYRMMLDFYGMRLVSRNTGAVARSDNWQDRYKHLNRSTHNYRRITRIIQSLGELGYERFQVPWITFLIEESVVNHVLSNLNGPCMKHWIGAIKDELEREHMHENYIELFKKPKPEVSNPPKPMITSHDTQKSKSAEEFANDTADTVDHGPAAESSHAISTVPSDVADTGANGEQRNKCNGIRISDSNMASAGRPSEFTDDSNNFCPNTASVDFGCAKDDALACQ
ncbi:opioid growth factor receptor-like protein 1 [Mercenaria mercenaria]|uniref:opioid growth factor receptor-like protein 1 n=1 Tax=Mercenaria mercenaria TaxID=6596 RepID=UPI00234EA611|nr:opioid growth factor receptor-like protein 1 [Mercenaria mercenaria]